MNPLYEWYRNSRDSMARYEIEKQGQEAHELDEQIDEIIKELQEAIEIIDLVHPHFKEYYMRAQEIQKSFTAEQIDHICCQIGDWYLRMRPLLEGEHNLGHMKEKLKMMICGDGE
jgi:tRNA C32,U32 (ribose-2'-O)-methylase TrmJ